MLNFKNNKMIPIPHIHAKKAFSKNNGPNLIYESDIQALGGDDNQHKKQNTENETGWSDHNYHVVIKNALALN